MTTARSHLSSVLGPVRAAAARYGEVLARPGAVRFFLPAAVARLGAAMTGLGMLFSIQHGSGSFGVAGAATGLFAVAEAVAGPQVARLVDRWGQPVTLPPVVAVHVGAIVVAVVTAGTVPTGGTLVAVAVAGATIPQPGALSAARWSCLLPEPAALRVAFSLEAVVNDVVFLSGPILVTLASTLLVPWAGSAAAATLVAVGCIALAIRRDTAPPPSPGPHVRGRGSRARRDEPASSLLTPAFLATLGVNLGLGCFFGAVPLLVTAAAAAGGLRAFTGAVLALSSAASIVSGLAYGSLRRGPQPRTVQLIASLVLTAGVAVGVVIPTLPGLAIMLLVGGTAIAPLLASTSQIVQSSVDTSRSTQGFTWINSASAAGIAGGAALTGAAIAYGGIRTGPLPLAALVLIAVAYAAASPRPRGRARPPVRSTR